jgi:hypothetical protein
VIYKEYLHEFIANGGAAVKALVWDDAGAHALNAGLINQAAEHGLVFASVSSADVKLHMIQDVFFAVSRQIAWESDAQLFVEGLFQRQGYQWPCPGKPLALTEVAEANKMYPTILRREFNSWLCSDLMNDTDMAQDFRIAVIALCLNRLGPTGHGGEEIAPILQWLRGELRLLVPLKSANIYSRITRHNARAMLRSLCRWLTLAGHHGLFLTVDIRQLRCASSAVAEGMQYSSGAVMDAYEVLRQLVDDAEVFKRLFVAIITNQPSIWDDRGRGPRVVVPVLPRRWNCRQDCCLTDET